MEVIHEVHPLRANELPYLACLVPRECVNAVRGRLKVGGLESLVQIVKGTRIISYPVVFLFPYPKVFLLRSSLVILIQLIL